MDETRRGEASLFVRLSETRRVRIHVGEVDLPL